jgi:hypothetical protein
VQPESPILGEILSGQGLYLSQAARLLPRHRQNRPVHPTTLSRWAHQGVRLPDGTVIRLEAVRCAGRLVTTAAALKRFLASQSPAALPQPHALRSPGRRCNEQRRAAELLRTKHGI